jgi:FixJ family two-component response regulator
MTGNPAIYLVDDDPAVLKALARLLRESGYDVRPFDSPRKFLEEHDPALPGCALLDISMPGLDGLELQEELASARSDRQIVFITGHGDIPGSVKAMRAGAIDFLTKPVDRATLLLVVEAALERDALVRAASARRRSIDKRLESLTMREREVLERVVKGLLNKQIAAELGPAEKTIKVHRARMMEKMQVRSVAELVSLIAGGRL